MSDAFVVDVRDLIALGNRCAGARAVVQSELATAGQQAGLVLVAQAVQDAPLGETGRLRSGIGPPDVQALSNGITVRIVSHAPYSIMVEKGRRGFGPSRARVLHFFVHGEEVFTKFVRAVAPHPFLAPALTKTAARTTAIFGQALDRATARILGGR